MHIGVVEEKAHQKDSNAALDSPNKDTGSWHRVCRTEKMAFIVVLGIITAVICPAALCCRDGTLGRHPEVQKDQDTKKQLDSGTLASINTDFAFSLYKELALKNPNKNIAFSPLSISAALASLSLGAKGNTLQEILEGLKFNLTETTEIDIHQNYRDLLQRLSQPGGQGQISRANLLFVEKHLQILNGFKEKAKALYQTEVFATDFQQTCEARKFINDYVMIQSQGKIKEMVTELEERTSIVMLNFLLFTGQWSVPFDPDDTFMGKFILDSRRPVKVLMMKTEDLTTPYFWDEELKCTVVELNYKGHGKAMFILPDQGKMEQVEASLHPGTLRKWTDSLKPRIIDELHLPKFSLSKTYKLENILPELGIMDVFNTQADLSGIAGAKDVRVSQMIHNTVLGMAETGTEAEATTRVEYNFRPAKLNDTFVNFVRKFLYMVLEPNSELISFMRKMLPQKKILLILLLTKVTSIPHHSKPKYSNNRPMPWNYTWIVITERQDVTWSMSQTSAAIWWPTSLHPYLCKLALGALIIGLSFKLPQRIICPTLRAIKPTICSFQSTGLPSSAAIM